MILTNIRITLKLQGKTFFIEPILYSLELLMHLLRAYTF